MTKRAPAPLLPYGIAVLVVPAATGITLLLWQWLDPLVFLVYFLAVMVAGWYGGFGPGLLATLLSVIAANYFLTRPQQAWTLQGDNLVRGGLFILCGTFISLLNQAQRRARAGESAERHRLEEAERTVSEVQGRLHLAMAASHMGWWTRELDESNRVIWSPELEAIFGLEPGEFPLTEEAFFDCVHPDDRDALTEAVARAIRERTDYDVEFRFMPQDGGVRWMIGRGRATYDPTGRPIRLAGIGIDVTERKGVEHQQQFLMAITDRVRGLRDPQEVLGTVVTMVGRHLQVSRCSYAEVDAEENAVVELEYCDGVPTLHGRHSINDFGLEILLPLQQGSTLIIEDAQTDPRTEMQASAYAAIQVRAAVSVPLVKEGRLVSLFTVHSAAAWHWTEAEIALLEQVAERTWLAVQNARAEEALRVTAERLRLALEAAHMGNWSWDAATRIVTLSPQAAAIFGVLPNQQLTWPQLRERLHEDDRERAQAAIERAIAERSDYDIEYRVLPPGSPARWVAAHGRTLYGLDSQVEGMLGVVQDVTARKQVEEALRDADRRKDEFLAMLAHELRNPLAPILNAAAILRLRGPDDPLLRRQREVIERQTRHLARLVDDLLEVSRITRGKIELRRELVDLRSTAHHAVQTSSPLIEARQHDLQLSLPPEPLAVEGDPDRLQQVLANLLNNAAKYTPPGGQITLSAAREGHEAVLRVRDTGEGIAPELLPHVFDLFMQGDRSLDRSQGGLGIGLTMVQCLVEAHGGSVEASSDGPGHGSEFVVRLPAMPELSAAAGAGSGAAPDRSERSLRILVVEDNLDSAETLAQLLELWGHEARVVHSGADAIAAARRYRPQVVLLDIGLPGMDGFEVARALRAEEGERWVLVALTGYGQAQDRDRGRAAGMDHYLTKPVDAEALQALLASL